MKNTRKTTLTLLYVALSLILSSSCTRRQAKVWSGDQDHLIMSVLWFQKSAEMRALFLQGYNIATERLVDAAGKKGARPLAVVADLDETILDNSPYEVWLINTGNGFSDANWKEWTDRAEAKALDRKSVV